MRIYVIRHGESETNQKGLWTGWMDAPLTEKGREDAKRAGELLKQTSFDKIYTSDLCRAQETAKIALPADCYEVSEALREISVGTLEGHPLSALTAEQRKNVFVNGYAEFGGEAREDLYKRISRFMKELEGLDCETVALFSHAGWLRGFLDTVMGIPLSRERMLCNNCTVAIFEYTNHTWKLHSWINPL